MTPSPSVTLISRRLVLGGAANLALGPLVRAEAPALTVNTDFRTTLSATDRAGLDAWVETLKGRIALWWPILTETLGSPGFTPTRTVLLRFITIRPEGIPAATSGDMIMIDPGGLLPRIRNPDTLGMIGHELVHVVQRYPHNDAGWLTEGVADYMRYYVLLPDDPGRSFDPAGADWRRGYQPTAGLLDFVERAHPGAVHEVNAAMRQGGDGPAALEKIGGAPLPQLWAAYMASRPPAADADAARRRARQIRVNGPVS